MELICNAHVKHAHAKIRLYRLTIWHLGCRVKPCFSSSFHILLVLIFHRGRDASQPTRFSLVSAYFSPSLLRLNIHANWLELQNTAPNAKLEAKIRAVFLSARLLGNTVADAEVRGCLFIFDGPDRLRAC